MIISALEPKAARNASSETKGYVTLAEHLIDVTVLLKKLPAIHFSAVF